MTNGPSNEYRPEDELTDAASSDSLSPEQKQVHLDAMKDTHRAQMRAAVLSDGPRTASAERSLHFLLSNLLYRAENDPEMVDLTNKLLGELGNVSGYGDSTKPLPESAKEDIKSVLIGATMALQMYRDRTSKADKQPEEHIKHVRHFLGLVKNRVGYIDENSGDTRIRMTVNDDQANDRIVFTKKKV